jgi:hypothetical protein
MLVLAQEPGGAFEIERLASRVRNARMIRHSDARKPDIATTQSGGQPSQVSKGNSADR